MLRAPSNADDNAFTAANNRQNVVHASQNIYLWLRPTCNTRSNDKYVPLPLQHVGVSLNREIDTILIIKFFIIQFFKIPYRAPAD